MIDDTTLSSVDAGALFASALWIIGVALLSLVLIFSVSAWALYRAGARRLTAALVTALSILAMGSLIVYGVGGEARPEAVALGSLAIGALAATLGQLASRNDHVESPPRTLFGKEEKDAD
jgi:hypothetical protein